MGELHTDTVISKPVGVVKTLFVASPQLFEKPFENFEKPNNIKQLFQLPIADWANVNDKHFTWKMDKEKISYEPKFSTNDIQAILHYVLNGMGVALLPEYLVKNYLATGELIQLLPNEPTPTVSLFLIYAHHRYPSAIVKAYVAFCEEWILKIEL